MIKKILIFCLVLLLLGCVGPCDWIYDLPGNYSINKINSENIILNKKTNKGYESVLDFDYTIKKFLFSEKYIVISITQEKKDVEEIYIFSVDSGENMILDIAEIDKIKEITDIKTINWISTNTMPSGAYISENDKIPIFYKVYFAISFIIVFLLIPIGITIFLIYVIINIFNKIKKKKFN